jgi:hypothetical protein
MNEKELWTMSIPFSSYLFLSVSKDYGEGVLYIKFEADKFSIQNEMPFQNYIG